MFHLVEGLALVMLCQCRLCPRRLAVHILREVKTLLKALNYPDTDLPVIDVIDKCCPAAIEKCLGKSYIYIFFTFLIHITEEMFSVPCSRISISGVIAYVFIRSG